MDSQVVTSRERRLRQKREGENAVGLRSIGKSREAISTMFEQWNARDVEMAAIYISAGLKDGTAERLKLVTPSDGLETVVSAIGVTSVTKDADDTVCVVSGSKRCYLNCDSEEALYSSLSKIMPVISTPEEDAKVIVYPYDGITKSLAWLIKSYYDLCIDGDHYRFVARQQPPTPYSLINTITAFKQDTFYDAGKKVASAIIPFLDIKVLHYDDPSPLGVIYCLLYDGGFSSKNPRKSVEWVVNTWKQLAASYSAAMFGKDNKRRNKFLDLLDKDALDGGDCVFLMVDEFLARRRALHVPSAADENCPLNESEPNTLIPAKADRHNEMARMEVFAKGLSLEGVSYDIVRLYGDGIRTAARQAMTWNLYNKDTVLPRRFEVQTSKDMSDVDGCEVIPHGLSNFHGTTLLIRFVSERRAVKRKPKDHRFLHWLKGSVHCLVDSGFGGTWIFPHELCKKSVFMDAFKLLCVYFPTVRCFRTSSTLETQYYWLVSTVAQPAQLDSELDMAISFREDHMYDIVAHYELVDLGRCTGLGALIREVVAPDLGPSLFACSLAYDIYDSQLAVHSEHNLWDDRFSDVPGIKDPNALTTYFHVLKKDIERRRKLILDEKGVHTPPSGIGEMKYGGAIIDVEDFGRTRKCPVIELGEMPSLFGKCGESETSNTND